MDIYCNNRVKRTSTMFEHVHQFNQFANELVRSLGQGCISLNRKGTLPRSGSILHIFDCALGMNAWVHIFIVY
jgi:hypothetical protein